MGIERAEESEIVPLDLGVFCFVRVWTARGGRAGNRRCCGCVNLLRHHFPSPAINPGIFLHTKEFSSDKRHFIEVSYVMIA